jgi:uncharacterized protein YqgC (DUF456 family)
MSLTIIIILSVVLFGLAVLSVVPALPIVPTQFVVVLLYAIFSGFALVSGVEIAIFGAIAALSLVVDYSAGALGAKIGGAHRWSVLAGLLGGVVGTFLLPPFGAFIGIPLCVFISESILKRTPQKSARAAGMSFLGAIGGVLVNGTLALTTAILFLVFVF